MSIDFIFHFSVISNTYNTPVGAQEADFFSLFYKSMVPFPL